MEVIAQSLIIILQTSDLAMSVLNLSIRAGLKGLGVNGPRDKMGFREGFKASVVIFDALIAIFRPHI